MRRAYVTLIATVLAACGATLADPTARTRNPDGTVTFSYDDSPDPTLRRIEAEARAWWATVGVYPPRVPILVGTPPADLAGLYSGGTDPYILVRLPRVDIVAHELGHAAGLQHVEGQGELMAPTVTLESRIGPATVAEAERVGAVRGRWP